MLQCQTYYETVYETKYEQKCYTDYEKKCHEVGYGYHKDVKCEHVPKQHCEKHPVKVISNNVHRLTFYTTTYLIIKYKHIK